MGVHGLTMTTGILGPAKAVGCMAKISEDVYKRQVAVNVACQLVNRNVRQLLSLGLGTVSYTHLRFEPYDRLQAAGNVVDRANYELVYSAPLAPEPSLEDIYTRFNICLLYTSRCV